MAISYGFFNSVNGDRLYNADDISNYFLKLISNGVFATPADAMQVQASSGLTVSVSAGWGFINCKWLNNDTSYNLTLDAADIVLNRIDRVVMRLNADSDHRNMELAIKKGTPAQTPTAPALTRFSGGMWELSLAQIYVGANVTEITQANITDERPDTTLCGFVTGLIDQIDTTGLFAQYNTAFWNWFNELQTTLATKTMIVRYTSIYTSSGNREYSIPINIEEYRPGVDLLNVYINGFRLVHPVDYIAGDTTISLTNPLDVAGTLVEFEVLKSVDGTDAESVVSVVNQINTKMTELQDNLGGLTFLKISKADFAALETKDPNKIYYVYDSSGKVSQYAGDAPLSSGSGAVFGSVIPTFTGNITNNAIYGEATQS